MMKYFEEMNSGIGFDSGMKYPLGVEKYRELYIIVMNVLLEKNKSNCRLVPFDCSGVDAYNKCMWLRVTRRYYSNLRNRWAGSHKRTEECGEDLGWIKSIEEANNMNLDDCMVLERKIDEDMLWNLLEALNKKPVKKVVRKAVKKIKKPTKKIVISQNKPVKKVIKKKRK